MRSLRLSLLLGAALLAGCADHPTSIESPRAEALHSASARSVPITVMSRNLALGADLGQLFAVQDPNQIPFVVATMWGEVLANDFPTRATAIAAEIAAQEPQLVGLQEVARYHLFAPGQQVFVLDYLEELLVALQARGLDYRVAASVGNLDQLLPIVTPTGLGGIRLDLRDVVLARADVQTSNPATGRYQAMLSIPTAAGPIDVPRGWTAVDATRHGITIRFVNTHLEAFHPLVNGAQATELAVTLAGVQKPVVLAGDINSGPGNDPYVPRRPAYDIFLAAGFSDAWSQANPGSDGFTCCFAEDLSLLDARVPDQRLDVVLFRQPTAGTGVDHASALLVGGEVGDRVWSSVAGAYLWPSDHIGIVATLQYREPRPIGR
jgi:endonuclease/exonuclease/phosphatase family metal-dependent hydrolase